MGLGWIRVLSQWLAVRGPIWQITPAVTLKGNVSRPAAEKEESLTIPLNVFNWPSEQMKCGARPGRRSASCRRNSGRLVFPVAELFVIICVKLMRGVIVLCLPVPLLKSDFISKNYLGQSVFSRVFRQLRGQTWQFHGPPVRRKPIPQPRRVAESFRQPSDKVCSRNLFKTPSSLR